MGRVHTTAAVMAACLLLCAPQAGEGKGDVPAVTLTEGSLTAHTLPPVTVYGVADRVPSTPTITKFGTQYNTVTEDQIKLQGSLDFYDALRNVPGVMFRKSNIIGGQTSHSVYIRGRGASHPSPDLPISLTACPAAACCTDRLSLTAFRSTPWAAWKSTSPPSPRVSAAAMA